MARQHTLYELHLFKFPESWFLGSYIVNSGILLHTLLKNVYSQFICLSIYLIYQSILPRGMKEHGE